MDTKYTERDLIVVGDSKKGIFNKRTCEYITDKIYDRIDLSLSGSHVVWNFKNGDKSGEIEYCAIVKTDGTIIETPDLIFRQGGFIDYKFVAGGVSDNVVAPVYSKSLNKHILVNTDGEKVCDGFDLIQKHQVAENELFNAYNFEDESWKTAKDYKILNRFGEVLDVDTNNQYSLDEYLELIKKYGPAVATVLPGSPSAISFLLEIINAGIEYNKKSTTERQQSLGWFTEAYKYKMTHKKIALDVDFNDIDFDVSYLKTSKIAEEYEKKRLINQLILPIYYFNTALQYGKIFEE